MTQDKAVDHKRIWLQPFAGDCGGHTWCEDRIEDDDIEYIRLDEHERALSQAYERGKSESEARMAEILKDPAAVRVNYLRGGIACQPLIDEAYERGQVDMRERAAGDRYVLVPEDPTAEMCADAVRFALSIHISSEYSWRQYMHDLYKIMLASAPPAIRSLPIDSAGKDEK